MRLSPPPYKSILTSVITVAITLLGAPAFAQSETNLLQRAREYTGRTITNIQFDPQQQPYSRPELLRLLPFHSGDRFRPELLPQAIQALFSTGRFADIAVDAGDQSAEKQPGLVLRFTTKPAYFVGHVAINGIKPPPNSGQLFAATRLNLGTRYFDDDRKRATDTMRETLRENGFYNATIYSAVEYDSITQEANTTFDLRPGDRARFEAPQLSGDPNHPYNKIVAVTHWKRLYGLLGWNYETAARLQQGLGNIRRYYERRDLLRAQVSLTDLHFDSEANTVRPDIHVYVGPKILVQVSGVRISRGKVRELVPVYQERSVDTDLLNEGQRNLQRYFQSQGYFGVQVTYTVQTIENGRTESVLYKVVRGPSHRLVAVEIHGNTYFSTPTIRERLVTTPADFPRYPRGRFSQDGLRSDVQAIENLYLSNGFQQVKITTRVLDDYRGSRDQIAVEISIQEGPQTLVSNLAMKGISPESEQKLRQILASSAGQPFSQANVDYDRDAILRFFYDQGYLDTAFQFALTHGADAQRVDITYTVSTGKRYFVRQIYITGLETTRESLVFDRISLEPGQPLSLAQQTETQRRLSDLGIFARVNSALQDPDGVEDAKNVLYDISEARHYALTVGVGAQIARIGGGVTTLNNPAGTTGFAPRVAIGITRENFLGLGQTVGLQTALSTIEQRAAITYFIPQFVSNDKLNLTTTALIDNSNDIRTFSSDRREVSMQLGEQLSRQFSLQYRLVFRHVTESNLKINPLLVPLLSQPETVGLAEVSFIQDRRDDPTDAHRGVYTTIDVAYAPAALGSQTQFARGLIRNSTYHQLTRNVVLARGTQFGLISRTGGHPSVPLPERIYSGGSTSIRAFPDFQAGPRDLVTGFPLGGNALFINNTEIRFPVYGENLGGVLFHDAGNVYSSLGAISFRFRQPNLQNFNYLVQDFGIGVRYRTPIGPLRVDLSFSPDAPRFFGLKGTLEDYVNGTAISTVQKINAFQFHISLGQAF